MSGIRYELLGVDGSLWKFGDPLCPVRLATTPTGLGGAPFKHQRLANARQPGADWVGRDDEINVIGLDVRVGPMTPGKPARDVFKRWRAALGYGDEVGEFRVYLDDEKLWQETRFEEPSRDPDLSMLDEIGFLAEKVKIASDLSWWHAPAIVRTFTPAQFDKAQIPNDGDVDSWLHYEIHGPGEFTVGVGDDRVQLPYIGPDEVWDIETDEQAPHIHDGLGRDVWERVGVQRFARSVRRSSTAAITLEATGTGATTSVKVTLPQLYRRASG
ncbi:hypothetical protein GS504_15600 [Rhodococcus hoagii]|nr:hypothetical protein [Prescottella equi]NKR94333.1 hypothetical protein [Prescottella equi]NKS58883.1 hypothetical protein [Prescottella equi]NKS69088.1 hypothetical protein [Prescottella equi]